MRRSFKQRRRGGEAGFTLIELLVALAVLSTSLIAIGALVATNARGTVALDRRLSLVEATRAILTGLPDRQQIAPGTLSGDYNFHHWQVDTGPVVANFINRSKPTPWVPELLVVRVKSPGGQQLRIETVRLKSTQDAGK